MKLLIPILLTVFTTGCMTTMHGTNQGYCANRGQVFAGSTDIYSGQPSAHAISCRPAESKVERCVVTRMSEAEAERHDLNQVATWRNWALGFGYALYVAPGAGLYYLWQEDDRERVLKYRSRVSKAEACYENTAGAGV